MTFLSSAISDSRALLELLFIYLVRSMFCAVYASVAARCVSPDARAIPRHLTGQCFHFNHDSKFVVLKNSGYKSYNNFLRVVFELYIVVIVCASFSL